jgi:peptidoglycan/LPS O-acetylase OafA/YrhL
LTRFGRSAPCRFQTDSERIVANECPACHKWAMQAARENLPLTAIRGIAAAWVVAHHMQPFWFPDAPAALASGLMMGHTAVDIFFVLSGFILTRVYGPVRFRHVPMFWLRRICRVYPLHLSVMAALALSVLAASATGGSAHAHDWSGFFVVTLLLQSILLNDSPWNPASWSVGVELLCYAIFPLTVRLMGRVPGLLLAGIAMALVLAEALVLQRYDGVVFGQGAILRGLVGFHLGAVLCLLLPRLPVRAAPAAALAGVIGIAVGIGAASQTTVVLAAAVTIVALDPARGLVARVLSQAPLVWLGRVSFSIYLLHVPLFVALNRVLPHFVGRWAMAAAFVVIMIPLSEAAYQFIEQPGRRLPALLNARLRTPRRNGGVAPAPQSPADASVAVTGGSR